MSAHLRPGRAGRTGPALGRRRRGLALTRRLFVGLVIGLATVLLLGWTGLVPAAGAGQRPAKTPIEHFIMLMQENHSFDNYFGTYPGADGLPADICMPVDPFAGRTGACVRPFRIGDNDVQMDDPDHSDETHRLQYNQGLMNGFVYALNRRGQDGRLAMGYYDGRDLPYYWNIADEYVLFDRFFSSASGGSFINHFYWVAAAPGGRGAADQALLAATPTIFDRLQENGVTWKFYIQNYDPELTYRTAHLYPGNRSSQVIWAPLLSIDRFLDDPVLNRGIVDLEEYYLDLHRGTLPQVAFIVPSGPSEHPPSSLLSGQRFVKSLLQALMKSPYWSRSAFLWTYDDWGGWYDHVPPPNVDDHGYGFRVPALLVSAYARPGVIDHTELDYTSALKFIEENWGLAPLATRDAAANSIVGAFDFEQPPRPARFVPFARDVATVRGEPRRDVIYIAYGSALLLATGFLIGAQVWSPVLALRRARRPDALESPGRGTL